MKRVQLLLALLSATLVAASGVAWAITNGTLDGTKTDSQGTIYHPYVGALLYTDSSGVTYPECSGTLISQTVFLTAAHCNVGSQVKVSFAREQPQGGWLSTSYPGTFVADSRYDGKQGSRFDVAVVKFNSGISPPGVDTSKLPKVPNVGQLDSFYKQGQTFTAVGYGSTGQKSQTNNYPDTRQYATSLFQSVGPVYLKLTQNVNKTKGVAGGTCYGDSGGPNFVGAPSSTNPKTIAGITNTGDTVCGSTNTTLRLDTPSPSARDFVIQQLNGTSSSP